MSRIRVLFMTGSLNPGGTERNILHLATGLDKSRFDVAVYSDYEGEPIQAELRRRGVSCHALKGRPSVGEPFLKRLFLRNLPYQWRMWNVFRAHRRAVIHAFGFPMIYYAVILAWLAGRRKLIFAVQDWDVWKKSPVYRVLDRVCSRLANYIVADGKGAGRLAVERQGMDARKLLTVYDGVNTKELSPTQSAEATRQELGLSPTRPLAGVIARLDVAKKGQDVFLQAVPDIVRHVPRAQCVLVGDGPDRARIEALVAAMPEAARPVMAGFREDLANVIQCLDVVVIPSQWESVPKTLVESMWLGRAVVATRVGDIEEVLDDTCGVLVPPNDPGALAEAVASLMIDGSRRERLGLAAHERIVERGLTLDHSLQQVERLYSELAGCTEP